MTYKIYAHKYFFPHFLAVVEEIINNGFYDQQYWSLNIQ